MTLYRFRQYSPLLVVLAIGLMFRLLLWGQVPRTGFISDEGEYLAAATWLAEGRKFLWYTGYLWTRAPLYLLFLAAHLALFGQRLESIYVTQTLFSLVNIALVYALALRVSSERRTATIAALLMALYLPFALYPQVLLSETLFIMLLLAGFLALAHINAGRRGLALVTLAGVCFGLATLTRSLMLGFVPVVAVWMVYGWRDGRRQTADGRRQTADDRQAATENGERTRDNGRRTTNVFRLSSFVALTRPALLLAVVAAVVLPWTVYNSRLYGGLVVVDTTGAFNLMLGARTAYDGRRADAPPRNFVLTLLGQLKEPQRSQYLTAKLDQGGVCLANQDNAEFAAALTRAPVPQAEIQRLMTAEGVCLIEKRPLAFVAKSAGELLDFFQINYSGDERFTNNFTTGRLPPWYTLALFLLDDTLYVLALPLAALGAKLEIADWRLQKKDTNLQSAICNLQSLFLLWIAFNIAVAPVLFAINRFRVPLLPFVFIFAAYALVRLPAVARAWWRSRSGILAGGVALVLLLVAATPYAYFEPRSPGIDAKWPSYLGPYPSSVMSTFRALAARTGFLQQEQMRLALRTGDVATAEALRPAEIRIPRLGKTLVANAELVDALIAGARQPAAGLALLPEQAAINAGRDVEASVVRGDLLRSQGDEVQARTALGGRGETGFVDDANPVEWAWGWLHPRPTTRIDIGADLDLGYLSGCYLGEGDTDANYRWCSDGAQIRFPGAGTGAAQTLMLRVDGRGWHGFTLAAPTVRVLANGVAAGSFVQNLDTPQTVAVALPPTVIGSDVVITFRTPTFIPAAADYNNQQGPMAGQVRRLGMRLDWVELK